MKLALVVPMLNEAAGLPGVLAHLHALPSPQGVRVELHLVDGGSTDDTVERAQAAGHVPLVSAPGRAIQMNTGAEAALAAGADALVFLHADTHLPAQGLARIVQALRSGRTWGRFDVRIEGQAWALPLVASLMNLRSRLSGIATGDQCLFMTAAAYRAVGGFPDQPLMEDIEMSQRLLRLARPACLGPPVLTSGRRWDQQGVWSTIALMWRLRWLYWRGVPASQLVGLYRRDVR